MRAQQRIVIHGLGFRFVYERDGEQRIETIDIAALRDAIGERLLVHLLRCFVWADRFTSMFQFMYWSSQQFSDDSRTHPRNLHSAFWSVLGGLYEASEAISALERAGLKGRLSDTTHWDELAAMATRWRTDVRLRRLRNKIGFHVDDRFVKKGLRKACSQDERWVILASDSEKQMNMTLRLGLEMLLYGTGMSIPEFEKLYETVAADHGAFAGLLEEVLLRLLRDVGALK